VHVLHRTEKAGLGPAYVAGFRWGRQHGFEVLVEMDADGSHAPEELPRLLTALEDADLVLGSRYLPGGVVHDWPFYRLALSRGGNLYTRRLLRLPLTDATGGYRAVRASLVDRLPFDEVASEGYCFQVDWAWRAVRAGARVVEVPISFTERAFGRSKMSGSIVAEALVRVTAWGLRDRLADRLPGRVRRPVPGRARDGGRSSGTR
jgi:dolichol-phosphate mannosyltransferase